MIYHVDLIFNIGLIWNISYKSDGVDNLKLNKILIL